MIKKRALLVGIDEYDEFAPLGGCVNDVKALEPLMASNTDESTNFHVRRLISATERVERRRLLQEVDVVLKPGADVALIYFAGHGFGDTSDVTLNTQDGAYGDPGVALSEILGRVQSSKVPQVIVVLDCCFSGAAGRVPQLGGNVALLREGVALLAASRGDQTAAETPTQRGLFSTHLCDALEGGAADVLGNVSLAGVYAYLSESFDAFEQRPTFKANLEEMYSLRQCGSSVPKNALRRLPKIFPVADEDLPLDPSYEPTAAERNNANVEVFAILQRCRDARLVIPVDAPHLYGAAMDSKACRLTALGKHYRQMAERSLLD